MRSLVSSDGLNTSGLGSGISILKSSLLDSRHPLPKSPQGVAELAAVGTIGQLPGIVAAVCTAPQCRPLDCECKSDRPQPGKPTVLGGRASGHGSNRWGLGVGSSENTSSRFGALTRAVSPHSAASDRPGKGGVPLRLTNWRLSPVGHGGLTVSRTTRPAPILAGGNNQERHVDLGPVKGSLHARRDRVPPAPHRDRS